MTDPKTESPEVLALQERIRALEAQLAAKPPESAPANEDETMVMVENTAPRPLSYRVHNKDGEGFLSFEFGPRPLPDPKNPTATPRPLADDKPIRIPVPKWVTVQVDMKTLKDGPKAGSKVPFKNKDGSDRLGPMAAAIKRGTLQVQAA